MILKISIDNSIFSRKIVSQIFCNSGICMHFITMKNNQIFYLKKYFLFTIEDLR